MSVFDKDTGTSVMLAPNEGPYADASPDWGQLPEKVNPQMPDRAWELTQETAKLSLMHLHAIMQPNTFKRMNRRDQARFISIALNRAYGSVDGAIRKHVHMSVDPEGREGYNEMANMARKAQTDYPELRRSKAQRPEEEETVVPLRRSKEP